MMKNCKFGKSQFKTAASVIGAFTAVMLAFSSILSCCLVCKLFRCINSVQKAAPEMEKAARLYQKKNSVTETESKTEDE